MLSRTCMLLYAGFTPSPDALRCSRLGRLTGEQTLPKARIVAGLDATCTNEHCGWFTDVKWSHWCARVGLKSQTSSRDSTVRCCWFFPWRESNAPQGDPAYTYHSYSWRCMCGDRQLASRLCGSSALLVVADGFVQA